jgi:uncharacterized membrane protein
VTAGSTPVGTLAEPRERLPAVAYARMAFVLRAGLLASLVVVVVSLAVLVARDPSAPIPAGISTPSTAGYLGLAGLASGLSSGAPVSYLTVGLLGLVATPLLRVASGLYYFRRGGERTIAAVAAVVLALLLAGIFVIGPLIR